MRVAAEVAKHKEAHPEQYCPEKRCLWRTYDGDYCPRHWIANKPAGSVPKAPRKKDE